MPLSNSAFRCGVCAGHILVSVSTDAPQDVGMSQNTKGEQQIPVVLLVVVTLRAHIFALLVPAHAPWLARRSFVRRVTPMTCHAPVRTGGAGGAEWDLD